MLPSYAIWKFSLGSTCPITLERSAPSPVDHLHKIKDSGSKKQIYSFNKMGRMNAHIQLHLKGAGY